LKAVLVVEFNIAPDNNAGGEEFVRMMRPLRDNLERLDAFTPRPLVHMAIGDAAEEVLASMPHLRAQATVSTGVMGSAGERFCESHARLGAGEGTCGRPLDEHGYCDRAGDHI
jgi:hypothetical protein